MKTKWIGIVVVVALVAVGISASGCRAVHRLQNATADSFLDLGEVGAELTQYRADCDQDFNAPHGGQNGRHQLYQQRRGAQPMMYQQQYCAPQQPPTLIYGGYGQGWSEYQKNQPPFQQQQQVVVQPAPQVIYQQAPSTCPTGQVTVPVQNFPSPVVKPTPEQVIGQPTLGTSDCGWVQVVNMSGYNAHIVWTGGSKDLKGQESVFLPFAKGRTVNLKAVMNYNGDNVDIASGTFVIGDIISAWTLRDPGDNGPIPTDPPQAL